MNSNSNFHRLQNKSLPFPLYHTLLIPNFCLKPFLIFQLMLDIHIIYVLFSTNMILDFITITQQPSLIPPFLYPSSFWKPCSDQRPHSNVTFSVKPSPSNTGGMYHSSVIPKHSDIAFAWYSGCLSGCLTTQQHCELPEGQHSIFFTLYSHGLAEGRYSVYMCVCASCSVVSNSATP